MNYLIKSLEKFKQDALSKVIYDLLKWFTISIVTILATKYLSKNTSLEYILDKQISINIFTLVIFSLVISILSSLSILIFERKRYKLLERDNYTDELTGLLNKKALEIELPKAIEHLRSSTKKLSLILIDIDDFKKFNSLHGYEIADKVLAKVGNLLKSDSRATDTLFRQYKKGDEFLIIARNTELSNAIIAANRKKELFNTSFDIDNNTFQLTVCCSVTEFDFSNDNVEIVLARLTKAMQIAKGRPNKNSVESLI